MTITMTILCTLIVFVFGLMAGAKLHKSIEAKKQLLEKFIKKPWGGYAVLSAGQKYKIKILIVNKGHRLSLQYHHQREEYWVVLEGTATIRLGEKMYTLQPEESFYVAKRALHRIENRHDKPVIILEVQIGDYLEEDDIIRVQDDYERNSKTDETVLLDSGKQKTTPC